MNKVFKVFLLAIILFFLFIVPVKADTDCGTIDIKISNYNEYNQSLSTLDCTNSSDEQNVITCNDLNLKKNLILSELMKANDEGKICESKQSEVDNIIEANKERCDSVFGEEFVDIINNIMTIFYVLGPILLIVFGSLDYTKATASGDEKVFKQANKNFIKRIIATILLFLTPLVVNLIVGIAGLSLNSNIYTCNYEYLVYNKEYKITASAKQQSTSSSSSTSASALGYGKAIAEAAREIKQGAVNNKYTYGYNGKSAEVQGTNSVTCMCCAEILGAALLKSGVVNSEEASFYQTGSAPGLARKLVSKGWIVIDKAEDLQPGDVVFYQKLVDPGTAGIATINGQDYHICHTEIYYGDGKVINTGDNFKNVVTDFHTNSSCYGVSSKWIYGFRYPGNE